MEDGQSWVCSCGKVCKNEKGMKIQPSDRGFMDDMTVASKSVVEARWTLEELNNIITWVRMKFKAPKSRSLVLKKGKVTDRYRFKIGESAIPSLESGTDQN